MSARAAELAARASYGRLLAILAARTRDIAAAEDALAEAFVSALEQWPRTGVPDRPEAWLLTAAKRRVVDVHRRRVVRADATEEVSLLIEELGARADPGAVPDDRLRLLFVCTHPAIDPAVQVPLMLQTVLGLDAAAIASAFRVAPKTMGQRLWRAKVKIREAGIPFETPEDGHLPERLGAVLEAIYAAYGTAWEDVRGSDARLRDLSMEAIFLGRLLVALLPEEPEALGLLALMLFAEARRPARRSAEGAYVPLERQEVSKWSMPLLEEAKHHLIQASRLGRLGPFQLEAAIQSAHVSAAFSGVRDPASILQLYEGLVALTGSLGALVSRAAALIEAEGGEAALRALDAIPATLSGDYQPWWAVRAAALRAAGRDEEARDAYQRAMGLTEDDAIRRFLAGEMKP